jgi:hypothetical protein
MALRNFKKIGKKTFTRDKNRTKNLTLKQYLAKNKKTEEKTILEFTAKETCENQLFYLKNKKSKGKCFEH